MKLFVAVVALAACAQAQVGPAGIIDPSGRNIQFSHAFAHDADLLIGPSGIVGKNGNIQLTHGQAELHNRARRAVPYPLAGPSGIIFPDGTSRQYTLEEANNIAVSGPSGIVTKNGQNIQFGSRKKRSTKCLQGPSGIVCPGGNVQFPAHGTIVHRGPSGIVFSHGQNVQLPARKRRSVSAFGTPCLQGPSGLNCGKHGVFQLTPGTTFASVGDSGIVTSDGKNIQFIPA